MAETVKKTYCVPQRRSSRHPFSKKFIKQVSSNDNDSASLFDALYADNIKKLRLGGRGNKENANATKKAVGPRRRRRDPKGRVGNVVEGHDSLLQDLYSNTPDRPSPSWDSGVHLLQMLRTKRQKRIPANTPPCMLQCVLEDAEDSPVDLVGVGGDKQTSSGESSFDRLLKGPSFQPVKYSCPARMSTGLRQCKVEGKGPVSTSSDDDEEMFVAPSPKPEVFAHRLSKRLHVMPRPQVGKCTSTPRRCPKFFSFIRKFNVSPIRNDELTTTGVDPASDGGIFLAPSADKGYSPRGKAALSPNGVSIAAEVTNVVSSDKDRNVLLVSKDVFSSCGGHDGKLMDFHQNSVYVQSKELEELGETLNGNCSSLGMGGNTIASTGERSKAGDDFDVIVGGQRNEDLSYKDKTGTPILQMIAQRNAMTSHNLTIADDSFQDSSTSPVEGFQGEEPSQVDKHEEDNVDRSVDLAKMGSSIKWPRGRMWKSWTLTSRSSRRLSSVYSRCSYTIRPTVVNLLGQESGFWNVYESSFVQDVDEDDDKDAQNTSSVMAVSAVLQRCHQEEPLPFEEMFPDTSFQSCRKIGEGVYGEVFSCHRHNGLNTVMKVIPIEGSIVINGERQKTFEEILSEIVIAGELSALRENILHHTDGFVEVVRCWCVRGQYPSHLLHLWDQYAATMGSENDSPEVFAADQLFIVLELANGGTDLEAFVFGSAEQASAIFRQVAYALAVAECALEFEHRDLHWGNILIAPTVQDHVTFHLYGDEHIVATKGVKATIIDFTLSRMSYDGCCIYNDLSVDPGLFTSHGDYQFEVYRQMQSAVGDDWVVFEPRTNVQWLRYIARQMLNAVRYRSRQSRAHRAALAWLASVEQQLSDRDSAFDVVVQDLQHT